MILQFICSLEATYTGYDFTEEDNRVLGVWGHGRNENTERDYCLNALKHKTGTRGQVFVWKGRWGLQSEFPGCGPQWCCKKTSGFAISYFISFY